MIRIRTQHQKNGKICSSNRKRIRLHTPAKLKQSGLSEEQITDAICKYLELFSGAQLNRIAPSGFFSGGVVRKHRSPYIKRGVSDIQFVHNGRFIVFEVKTPKEHKYVVKHHCAILNAPSNTLNKKRYHIREQIDYIEGIKRNGFEGYFVCSIDMVKEIMGAK